MCLRILCMCVCTLDDLCVCVREREGENCELHRYMCVRVYCSIKYTCELHLFCVYMCIHIIHTYTYTHKMFNWGYGFYIFIHTYIHICIHCVFVCE